MKLKHQESVSPDIHGLRTSNFYEVGKSFLPIHPAIGGKSSKKGGDIDMRTHLHQQVNRKVSRFIMGEEGKVGSQSAFTAAAFIGATSLAGILLNTPNAAADGWCGGLDCHPDDLCCYCYNAAWNADYQGCNQGEYDCRSVDLSEFPGISCWTKP